MHPVYRAFNMLGYDVFTLGNHEFNYGLDFLNSALKGAKMPAVNSNVYSANKKTNYFKPYVILQRTVTDDKGKKHSLRIGVIGFIPPQLMEWDKEKLEGKVHARSILESAKKFVPIMKKKGSDIIVALAHTGISSEPYTAKMENAAYYLTKIEGIDAILTGHSHKVFPGPLYKDLPAANLVNGTINSKPVVMAGSYGNNLGIIDLKLQKDHGKWIVVQSKASTRPISDENGNSLVKVDEPLFKEIEPEHKATIEYVNKPIGKTSSPIYSYFSLVQDDYSVQIVNQAQSNYLQRVLKDARYSKYAGIPILSAAAPFKAGGRGTAYYTDIPAGTLAIKNITDLYLYPNTLQAVLINGAQLKEWLEMSAGQFQQIIPAKGGEQQLINPDFRSSSFDVIDGVNYQVDVTKPAKYDPSENLINAGSNRILKLTYKGKPVTPDQKFIIATNNYRASSKTYPGVSRGEIIYRSPDENKQIVADYIKENKTINPTADKNWAIAPIKGNVTTVFNSSPEAKKYALQSKNITYIGPSFGGFAKYTINLETGE
ncbi:bifunctional 2',3'-cyclic-nucleotide 2'-phosphodiesterase/3'-nucleotidase [Neobacillus sp. PS3-34]|uniref:bifunctional 2',3'-cyclic-nucleotide 2'-phosphodiesterase/3'-nucleotidase n=1 Tax=Neobacillus sp. PS3-34 TaxID=3070678 RepID=UPI0027E0C897|nr:bifunctional 2',3'-cyclic-nucleotide 2'-phosphodiesterase/3'-nucleotidase [Neobacillus sp. PS3-34]WML50545.1 bifunctional 2',3'-cyclic-nucleotide 2'-phosphodiesterase/3'-nucleotidase [Neobacillus sp. PS3-34]